MSRFFPAAFSGDIFAGAKFLRGICALVFAAGGTGAGTLCSSSWAAEQMEPAQVPSAAHRFVGDARIFYAAGAVAAEVGGDSKKEMAIKVDVAFGKSHGLPSGIVYVDFRGADMLLIASQLQWLMVSPKQIELKGPCFLDDSDGFTFQMKIERGSPDGKQRVRIKVWETDNPAHVVFDNQRDDKWSAPVSATSEIASGELRIS